MSVTLETLSKSKSNPMDRHRNLIETSHEELYKSIGDISLKTHYWDAEPDGNQGPMPAAAFFYSSGWDHGQISQFAPYAAYLASRGIKPFLFDYRVSSKSEAVGPIEALQDARSAIIWLRLNAARFNIDPQRIVGIGGSGGAHAIAGATILNQFAYGSEGLQPGGESNALILFNPVLDTSAKGFGLDRFPNKLIAKEANLVKAVRKGLPPTLIIHGTADRVIPYSNSVDFAKASTRKKNFCQLIEFEGQGHGFFNFNVSFDFYEMSLIAIDDFLIHLNWLSIDSPARITRINSL
jgi:acetyl esterase/lipase